MMSKLPLSLCLLLLVAPGAYAFSDLDAWTIWDASDESAATVMDHSAWDKFLGRYVSPTDSGINLVAYASVTAKDRSSLQSYIEYLTEKDPRQLRKTEQLAYWVNLYNALTVEVVLRNPRKSSIRKMGKGFLSSGPWGDKLIEIAGESLSLDDIEHRILRPIWRDHRIHYAVNCASISCPNLAVDAYTAENADEMFSMAEKAYINHDRGVSVDANGRPTLSKIFTWYSNDFADNETDLLRYLSKHHTSAAAALAEYDGRVRYEYDWNLNTTER